MGLGCATPTKKKLEATEVKRKAAQGLNLWRILDKRRT